MAWNNQGGPWGGGGNGGGGPWGGGGPTGGPNPPDLEEMIRRSQDKMKQLVPGGKGRGLLISLVVAVVVVIWASSGMYRVEPEEQGVELLFGQYVKSTQPGLHIWFPAPIGEIYKPNVTNTNALTIGFRGEVNNRRVEVQRDVPEESLMLTGDQNIVDADFVVQWRIKNAADYLFNIRDPETTIKAAAESAMREVIGQRPFADPLTDKKVEVNDETLELLQSILDTYGAGIQIAKLELQRVDPPKEVIDAFNDVQRAKQDKERLINEAKRYLNDILPRARGQAERMIQEATAFKQKVITEAEGEAQGFLSVYDEYRQAADVTRTRLYLENMQDVLKGSDKVLIDDGGKGGEGVVPYLPLPEVQKRMSGRSAGEAK